MKNHLLRNKVVEIFSKAEEANKKAGFKKFFPMSETKGHKLIEYGLYNGQTKKYVLFDCYSRKVEEHLKEMEKFVNI